MDCLMAETTRKAGFAGDSRVLTVGALLVALVISAALFVVSYQGLAVAGASIGLNEVVLAGRVYDMTWVVPLAIDGGILVAGLLAAVRRGQKRKATLELSILWGATVASSAANLFAHLIQGDGALAMGVGSVAPIFFLAITESIIRTVIQDEVAPRKSRRAKRTVVEPAVASPTVIATPVPSASKPAAPKRETPRVAPSLDALEGEVRAMYEEFVEVANNPASSSTSGGAVSERMTELLVALVDDHDVRAADLARAVGHPNAARLRSRLKKARDEAAAQNLVNA